MIKEISITNFYSFGHETIKLQPDVTIMIGINGSGKSNFLKAVRLLKEGVAGKGLRAHIFDDLGGFDNMLFKGKRETDEIEIEYTFDGAAITNANYGFRFYDDLAYKIKIFKTPGLQNYYIQEHIETKKPHLDKGFIYLDFKNGIGRLHETLKEEGRTKLVSYSDYNPQELVLSEVSDTDRYYALTTIRKAIRDILVYDYFDTTFKSPIRKATIATSDKRLNSDGTNLPQILNTIKINHKSAYRKIVEILEEVNAGFSGFDFNLIGGSNIELMLEEKSLGSSVHVSNISDGTLRYLCLLAILYNPDRGKFICIDEPEVGLHPDMILNIADAIKEAAQASTLIITTHSADLLNYFKIENLRIFEKDDGNATKVISYTEQDFEGWYEEFTLGKMWKAGDLGGVRYGG
jgi:predicted ATPase